MDDLTVEHSDNWTDFLSTDKRELSMVVTLDYEAVDLWVDSLVDY